MTITATSSRRRRGARIAGTAAAFGAAAALTGLLSSGLGAGDMATASAVVHAAGESTTEPGEPVAVAARRTNKSNSSDYLKVTLKEAG